MISTNNYLQRRTTSGPAPDVVLERVFNYNETVSSIGSILYTRYGSIRMV